ncbi:MAG: DUF4350 domain-containing protein [Chloroflexi bacterium]|nr:DUF4350 domain-containing protein [Chloroflexota bacterium]
MSRMRDILVITGLFGALIAFIASGPGREPPQAPDAPTTYSSAGTGALALYEWTRAMGYDSRRLEYRPFVLADEDDVLVMLNPGEPVTRSQARDTLAWVERGGMLILADDTPALFGAPNTLLEELRFQVAVITGTQVIERVVALQPAFDEPPVGAVDVRAGRALLPLRNDYAPLLGAQDALLIAGVRHGRGYVYLSAATRPFTNDGLRDPQSAALVLNMLRRVPPGGRILFDEYHHGLTAPPAPADGLLRTPWGWAGVYAAIITALFVGLNGRRFGRAVPLREESARRSSAEYVESMADLFQRGGKRQYMQRHYHASVKRRLARPYGLNPHLDDAEFVYELGRMCSIDEAALLVLLGRLRRPPRSDSELLHAVVAADAFIAAQFRR